MNRIILLAVAILFCLPSLEVTGQDTTWVQTYTFEAQNNPETAYDSPGRRWFTFPEEGEYRKILMYHKLKCFEDGTAGNLGFPCGEWDYLSYDYLFDHTGVMDSTAAEHPLYLLNNTAFIDTSVTLTPVVDHLIMGVSMGEWDEGGNTFTVGSNTYNVINGLHEGDIYKTQILYTADELIAAGLTEGNIQAIEFTQDVNASYESLRTVSLASSANTELNAFVEESFQEVYNWFTSFEEGPADEIVFTSDFYWDGVSGIVVQIEGQYNTSENNDNAFEGDLATSNMVAYSSGNDHYLELGAGKNLEVPAEAFATVDEEITISVWVNGDADILPINTYLFEGVNANNQRVLNTHLPWGNSRMYWDAGQDGGYDRIDKAASNSEIEGQWNHWAFTKNTVTEVMNIYLNGELWHTGDNKDNSMSGIVKFLIGSNAGGGSQFPGIIDDFRVWNVELDEATIADWMSRDLTVDHPQYDNLLVNYTFDEDLTDPFIDRSPNGYDGIPHGSPERVAYAPSDLFKNVTATAERAKITFTQGAEITGLIEDEVTVDVPALPVVVTQWVVDGNYAVIEDWFYAWTQEESVTYNETGDVVDSEMITLDQDYTNETLAYFHPPFEIIDRYELGRFITPYGINLDLEDGWTWVYDVTDFAPLLHGEVELQCGNWQELLDMKFAFIHGTPPRDVIRVENLWNGSFGLTTFAETVTEKEIDVEADEKMFKLKATTTGHGNPGCAEFCYNEHSVVVDGEEEWSWEIMQECADNPLRPQGGTWIYDRAGWCPGAPGKLQEFEITPLVNGQNSFTVDYNCEYESAGNYVFEAQLITYGDPNFANDVELDDILSPNNMKIKSHTNPMCNKPVVRIRNTGSTDLTSCLITFGINGNNETHEWTGSLGFMEYEDVELDYSDAMIYAGDVEELMTFTVTVSQPNGVTDENPDNNTGTSNFNRPPVYSYGTGEDDNNEVVFYLQTNNYYWETEYTLYDDNNNVVFSRSDFPEPLEAYRDTIQLNRGCYLFHLEDSGEDGTGWWADPNDGNGDVRLRKTGGGQFIQFPDDFGKEIYHYFYFDTDLVSVEEFDNRPTAGVQLYPNPNEGNFNLKLENFGTDVSVRVLDLNGKIVFEKDYLHLNDSMIRRIDLTEVANGMFFVEVSDGVNRVMKRIVVE